VLEKNYELIEHTADVGIRVKGSDLKELFINAAVAMFDIIAEQKSVTKSSLNFARDRQSQSASLPEGDKGTIVVKQKADNIDELFINWLNELLSLSATKEKIFCDFKFEVLNKNNLEAEVSGCDIKNYRINTEIKAATYHQLKIEQNKSGWQAEVIFDV